jgi:hypothetical protein
MPACPSCGTDNSDSARFCRGCGKGMTEVPPATVPGVSPLPQAQPGRSSSTNAALVIVLVLALVGLAGAAGYWFLAGPGKKPADPPSSVAAPAVSTPVPSSAAPAPMPAPQAAPQTPPPVPVSPAGDIPAPPPLPSQAPAANNVPPPVPSSPTGAPPAPPAMTAPVAPTPPAPPKPKRRDPDESAFFPDDGGRRMSPPPVVDPNVGRWDKLRAELYRCGYDQYCQERTRQRYCNGYWGRVPECVPPGSGYPQPGYPPPRGY